MRGHFHTAKNDRLIEVLDQWITHSADLSLCNIVHPRLEYKFAHLTKDAIFNNDQLNSEQKKSDHF